jgi:hypothetical protein
VDRQQRIVAAVVALAAVVLAFLYRQGKTPSISLVQESVGQSYSPFVFWMHQNPVGYLHHFPERIGVNTLPQPYQTEDVGQALNHVEAEVIDNAGCAQ